MYQIFLLINRLFSKTLFSHFSKIALYIGEICRYLLAQPEQSDDQKHSLRMLFGLGLNKEHWIKLRKRFNIPKIAEYYGSSEGNILIGKYLI